MTSELENKEYQFDKLTADRINQMVSIWEGNVLEMMKRNPMLTDKAKEFMLALNNTAQNFVDNSVDDVSGGKADGSNNTPKDGIAKNEKQLEALKEDLVAALAAQFPNLSRAKIEEYVTAFAGSVNADKSNIAEASDKKAKDDAKAAAEMAKLFGGLAIASAGLIAGGKVLSECEKEHNFAANMFKNPIMQMLLGSKDRENGIFS